MRRAGVISGVGYNFRWAPLVRYAARLVADGRVGTVNHYRGRFFSMYGSDPMGLLSWRFLVDEGGHGVSTDLMSHSVDLAHMLVGPIARVVGTTETFIRERPLPAPGEGPHYGRGRRATRRRVTNEDYAGCSASSRTGRAARSRRAGRCSGRRARWPSTFTGQVARSAGTSSA